MAIKSTARSSRIIVFGLEDEMENYEKFKQFHDDNDTKIL
jgi:hypothetical protein